MKEFLLLLPEILIALTLVFVILSEVTYRGERLRLTVATALVGLGAAFIQTLISYQYGAAQILSHAITIDGLSLFFKSLFIVLAGCGIVTASHSKEIPQESRTEYITLVLGTTLAMCIAAAAADMMLAFLALQFLNLGVYLLAGYGKRSTRSNEAAIKYMIFAVVSSGLFLYGAALLFAQVGSVNIYEIHRALAASPLPRTTTLAVFMLLFLSFSFQFAAFPMHLWAPDVIEGAPTSVSGYAAVASRSAGFATALRFLFVLFAEPIQDQGRWKVLGLVSWPDIVALAASLTMVIGALLSLRQVSAKRLVGSLIMSGTGFMLLGLLVLDEVGVAALLYSFVVELFAVMGAFYILSYLVDRFGSDRLEDMKGVLAQAVPECICLVIFLTCLVGAPPLPGFLGRFTLIGATVRHHWMVPAVIAVISMVISWAAVARLAFHLVGDFQTTAGLAKVEAASGEVQVIHRNLVLAALLIPMALAGVFANFVLDWAGRSLGFILW